MIRNNRNVLIYSLCFLLIFNLLFLPGFTDGRQTTNMFIIASFVIVILTFLYYLVLKFLLRKKNIPFLLDCLILFLLSELAVFCIKGGEICLFGIPYKLQYYTGTNTTADIVLFREQRDFALSMSFLFGGVICVIQNLVFYKRVSNIAPPDL
jgi:hypothetical protein